MGNSKRNIDIDGKAKSLRTENNALCLIRKVIYYELLKPGETVNTERYRQQMI